MYFGIATLLRFPVVRKPHCNIFRRRRRFLIMLLIFAPFFNHDCVELMDHSDIFGNFGKIFHF
jgi:hypothetical protein